MNEKDMFILDDRPDDDPRVIARREKEWNELPPEKREEIDKSVAKAVARIKEKRARENNPPIGRGMNIFLFDVSIVSNGWMKFTIRLGKNKFEFLSSGAVSGDMTKFLDACVYFHPTHDYEGCFEWSYDDEGHLTDWFVSVNREKSTKKKRILHIKVQLELEDEEIPRVIEGDVLYENFAYQVLSATNFLINKCGLLKYANEFDEAGWGQNFPITRFLEAKALYLGDEPESAREEMKLFEASLDITKIAGPIRKLRLVSQVQSYCMPEWEQRITLFDDGRFYLSTYTYDGEKLRTVRKKLSNIQSEVLIDDIADYFDGDCILPFATDCGEWDLVLINDKGKKYKFNGSLFCEKETELYWLSKELRSLSEIKDLFVFDGNVPYGTCFVSVSFGGYGKTYYYICEDDSIEEGDWVVVPVGANNRETMALVEDVEYFKEEEYPMDIGRIKKVIRRAEENDVLDEDE